MKTIVYYGVTYIISDEPPKNDDLVLTNEYGIWTFKEQTSMLPFWCNPNNCKKLIPIEE